MVEARRLTLQEAADAEAAAGEPGPAPAALTSLTVTIDDINAAARSLTAGLHAKAVAAAAPWERLLLVGLASCLKEEGELL